MNTPTPTRSDAAVRFSVAMAATVGRMRGILLRRHDADGTWRTVGDMQLREEDAWALHAALERLVAAEAVCTAVADVRRLEVRHAHWRDSNGPSHQGREIQTDLICAEQRLSNALAAFDAARHGQTGGTDG